ncbi:MAG: hypothetical protein Q8O92_06530 [Candidatus Latescibacter sp.]|nr:hypothetical protein [Candidatus Latescibacter sp.]
MSLECIYCFISIYTLASIIAFVTLVVVVWVVDMLIRRRRTEQLRRIAFFIDSIPFFAGLVAVTGFLTVIRSFSRAISAIAHSGTSDPRIVAAGFQEFFFYMSVCGGLFFIFLEAWLVVRMIYGSFLRELDTLPK